MKPQTGPQLSPFTSIRPRCTGVFKASIKEDWSYNTVIVILITTISCLIEEDTRVRDVL